MKQTQSWALRKNTLIRIPVTDNCFLKRNITCTVFNILTSSSFAFSLFLGVKSFHIFLANAKPGLVVQNLI